MNLNFKTNTFRMMDQVSEWGSIPKARVIENIIDNHFSNIRSKKVVLTLDNDLWLKLMKLSAEIKSSREDVIRLAIEELFIDYFPIVTVEKDID